METFSQKEIKDGNVVRESSLELKSKIISLIKAHKYFCEKKNLPSQLLMAKKWTLPRMVEHCLHHIFWARNLKEFVIPKKSDAIMKAEAFGMAERANFLTVPTTEIKDIIILTQIEPDRFHIYTNAISIQNNQIVSQGVENLYYSKFGEFRTLHVFDDGDIKFYQGQPPTEDKDFDLNQYLPDLVESINKVKSRALEATEEKIDRSFGG